MGWISSLGIREVRDLWRKLIAEFVGTFILVVVACGAGVRLPNENGPSPVHVSLVAGLTVALAIQCTCHVSGGHLNPAVTFAMLAVRKVTVVQAVLYVITQCIGCFLGAVVLRGLSPNHLAYDVGVTRLNKHISTAQGFGVEFLITFVLLFTVFAVCDERRQDVKGSPPLAMGFAVTIGVLFAMPFTGASMNPARSFGPALLANEWQHHWVYWVGPCFGGVAAGMFYHYLLRAPDPAAPASSTFREDTYPLFISEDKDDVDKGTISVKENV